MSAGSDQRHRQQPAGRHHLVRRPSLAAQTEQILADRLRSDEFGPGDQLPPEHELAEQFGVSRATVRAAIGGLARRGLVVQRHGVGTFATAGSRLTNNLAQATDLGELVRRHGTGSNITVDHIIIQQAPAPVAKALEIAEADPVVVSAKRFMADDKTLVYVINSIPVAVVGHDLADRMIREPEIIEPLFDFLETEAGLRPGPQLARIFPELGSDIAHPANAVPATTPVLRIEELGYSIDSRPIWHSQTWFPPGAMNMELIRQPPTPFF